MTADVLAAAHVLDFDTDTLDLDLALELMATTHLRARDAVDAAAARRGARLDHQPGPGTSTAYRA